MPPSKKLSAQLAFTLLLSISIRETTAVSVTSFEREWAFLTKQFNFTTTINYFSARNGPKFLHLFCRDFYCELTAEAISPDVETREKQACTFHVTSLVEKEYIMIRDYHDDRVALSYYVDAAKYKPLLRFGQNQRAEELAMYQFYEFTTLLLDMTTCEQRKLRQNFSYDAFPGIERYDDNVVNPISQVIVYNDGRSDVFYAMDETCSAARCKQTYDAEGEKIGQPVEYFSNDFLYSYIKINPLQLETPADDYIVSLSEDRFPVWYQDAGHYWPEEYSDVKVLHVKNGKIKELHYFDADVLVDRDYHENIFGVCWAEVLAEKSESLVTCEQFHSSDMSKILRAVLIVKQTISRIKVYNLPGGGFLLLSEAYGDGDACQQQSGSLHLRYVKSNGHYEDDATIEIADCHYADKCRFHRHMHITEPETDKICVIVICDNDDSDLMYGYCLPKADVLK